MWFILRGFEKDWRGFKMFGNGLILGCSKE